ncbi:Molybdopterin-guanine dinucleotide biosynthesis protein A [Friedmanniella luteola]|uniref:Molybdopterin-guanine dinucleotide biosynthesis protein A n=1 Tax=Friedmanniella luteola TaxID=546871 RepID=A0A1H1Z936_9ACTN|nr:NTP transferase domain-containing protein [Friedmanniella luteola]SDT30301.1 Molybdopterin-guanine dinucleotide biosynthesis protein A [Friedmanniella luteola]
MSPRSGRTAAVVLAGGTSRRFGTDKLAHLVDGRPLLDHTLAGLPDDVDVLLVGPPRPTARAVTALREDPPGGGPTAALVAGLRRALADGADLVLVLPGDAPGAGAGALVLRDALLSTGHAAVLGVDTGGREQPLQLALRPAAAQRLVELAGPDAGAGESARRLVHRLDPPPVPCALPPAATFDVDDHDQLDAWLSEGPRLS